MQEVILVFADSGNQIIKLANILASIKIKKTKLLIAIAPITKASKFRRYWLQRCPEHIANNPIVSSLHEFFSHYSGESVGCIPGLPRFKYSDGFHIVVIDAYPYDQEVIRNLLEILLNKKANKEKKKKEAKLDKIFILCKEQRISELTLQRISSLLSSKGLHVPIYTLRSPAQFVVDTIMDKFDVFPLGVLGYQSGSMWLTYPIPPHGHKWRHVIACLPNSLYALTEFIAKKVCRSDLYNRTNIGSDFKIELLLAHPCPYYGADGLLPTRLHLVGIFVPVELQGISSSYAFYVMRELSWEIIRKEHGLRSKWIEWSKVDSLPCSIIDGFCRLENTLYQLYDLKRVEQSSPISVRYGIAKREEQDNPIKLYGCMLQTTSRQPDIVIDLFFRLLNIGSNVKCKQRILYMFAKRCMGRMANEEEDRLIVEIIYDEFDQRMFYNDDYYEHSMTFMFYSYRNIDSTVKELCKRSLICLKGRQKNTNETVYIGVSPNPCDNTKAGPYNCMLSPLQSYFITDTSRANYNNIVDRSDGINSAIVISLPKEYIEELADRILRLIFNKYSIKTLIKKKIIISLTTINVKRYSWAILNDIKEIISNYLEKEISLEIRLDQAFLNQYLDRIGIHSATPIYLHKGYSQYCSQLCIKACIKPQLIFKNYNNEPGILIEALAHKVEEHIIETIFEYLYIIAKNKKTIDKEALTEILKSTIEEVLLETYMDILINLSLPYGLVYYLK